jgi:hypothetical protein
MLAITSPTNGGHSVGMVCSRARTMEFVLFSFVIVKQEVHVHARSYISMLDIICVHESYAYYKKFKLETYTIL